MGITVGSGELNVGADVLVVSKEHLRLGKIESIVLNHYNVDKAYTDQQVVISIAPHDGESPKSYCRHFDDKDTIGTTF